MANILTILRIVCSILILFFSVFSIPFYILYCISGISDMLDGYVARKTNTATEFGVKLDSIADFIFVVVCMVKIPPQLYIPVWLWVWIGIIVIIKIINILAGIVYYKKLMMPHTIANKITGLLLFIMPLLIAKLSLSYVSIPICAVATFAAIREGHLIRTSKGYKDL